MTDTQTVKCQLRMPDQSHFYRHIRSNAKHAKRVVVAGSHVGQSVVICGAGPSLREECNRLPLTDQVWACNSALPYLMGRDVRVTHGFAIDQGEAMLDDAEWGRLKAFNVRCLVASSISPTLTEHLLSAGKKLTWFHNYLGIPNPDGWTPDPEMSPDIGPDGKPLVPSHEMELYRTLYKQSVQVGHGLNAVPRAVCLALAMGFSVINVVGADCACAQNSPPMPTIDTPEYHDWMRALVMYADGRTASQYGVDAVMAEATIDGTRWHTRPDMIVSARHLVDLDRASNGRVRLIGHTLPNVFASKGPDFWEHLPSLTPAGEVVGFGNASLRDQPTEQPALEAVA